MGNNEPVTLAYDEIVTETDLAILFQMGNDKVWIPKSVIRDTDERRQEIDVPEWFAEKEGLV